MNGAEFDRHAARYREQHRQNISMTREEPAFFADYKMRDFKALVTSLDLPPDRTLSRLRQRRRGLGGSIPRASSTSPVGVRRHLGQEPGRVKADPRRYGRICLDARRPAAISMMANSPVPSPAAYSTIFPINCTSGLWSRFGVS